MDNRRTVLYTLITGDNDPQLALLYISFSCENKQEISNMDGRCLFLRNFEASVRLAVVVEDK